MPEIPRFSYNQAGHLAALTFRSLPTLRLAHDAELGAKHAIQQSTCSIVISRTLAVQI